MLYICKTETTHAGVLFSDIIGIGLKVSNHIYIFEKENTNWKNSIKFFQQIYELSSVNLLTLGTLSNKINHYLFTNKIKLISILLINHTE